jgi:phenylacetate 2-hydroxylase
MAGTLRDVPSWFPASPPLVSQLSSNLGAGVLLLISSGVFFLLLLFFFDKTDVPYIRNLPSVPGVPIFGNLFQLGTEHPKRLGELSKKYGPVFQIRLGNRVCQSCF